MISKKGFTLMELLVTILILVVILAIAIPSVMGIMNRGKERAYNTQIDSFLATTKDYVIDKNITEYDWIGDKAYVTLDDLANAGYINLPIKNPKNNKDFSVASCIIIDKTNKKAYDYTYNEKCNMPSGNLVAGDTGGANETSPYLSLDAPIKRNQIESIEIVTHKNIPNNVLGSYAVSAENDESVMLWYEAGTTPGLYKVYIGAEGRVYANENSRSLFANLTNLTNINIQSLDTTKVTSMYGMFQYTKKLTTIELGSRFITNNVTDMQNMFSYASSITAIKHTGGKDNVINFDTSQVTRMVGMFQNIEVTSLEFGPNFVTNKVTDMASMFSRMSSLTSLDISYFDFNQVTTYDYMLTNVSTTCKIIVNSAGNTWLDNHGFSAWNVREIVD